MRLRASKSVRRGAVIAEAAIVIVAFLTLVFGMIDLGIGTFRQTVLSQAARFGARQAIVHGHIPGSVNKLGSWGTTTVNVSASATGDPIADAIRPMLGGCNLSATNIRVEWPDGSNNVGKTVRVTVTSTFQPIMTFIFGNPTINLTASSTMLIAH